MSNVNFEKKHFVESNVNVKGPNIPFAMYDDTRATWGGGLHA